MTKVKRFITDKIIVNACCIINKDTAVIIILRLGLCAAPYHIKIVKMVFLVKTQPS